MSLSGGAALEGSGKRSLAYVAAAILIGGVLVSATLILVPVSRPPTTVTETFISTSTETTTSTSVTTTTETTTSTAATTVPAGCSPSQGSGHFSETLVAGTTSPAIICLQVYWFDSNATVTLAATSLLLPIESAVRGVSPLEVNFTVTASQDQLLLGGPTNANEGMVVAYSITAKPRASGTYPLNVQAPLTVPGQTPVQAAPIGAQGLGGCVGNIDLVAGNGQPNYVSPPVLSGCPVMQASGSPPEAFSIPGVSYQVPPNIVCYRIISLTNSTQ